MRYFLFSLFFHIVIVSVGGITFKKIDNIKIKEKPNQSLSIDFGTTPKSKNIENHNNEKKVETKKVEAKPIKKIEEKKKAKVKTEAKKETKREIKVPKKQKIVKPRVIEKKTESKKTEKIIKPKVKEKEVLKEEIILEEIKEEVVETQILEEENLETELEVVENVDLEEKLDITEKNIIQEDTTKENIESKNSKKARIEETSRETNNTENLQKGLSKLKDGSIVAKNQGVKGLEYEFLSQPDPNYPQIARRMGIKEEIIVKARFLIDYDGKISDIKFYDNITNYGFREEVIKALEKWRATQIKVDGKPVKLYFYKAFKFKLT